MCGIWAIFGSDKCVSLQCASCLKVCHRGPDNFRIENVPEFKNCAFGFHRLAIVDTVHGMQPFRAHALPHLWLCYNGEIYNHKLIAGEHGFKYDTHMDGEAIVHLYNSVGIQQTAAHLDGVFALMLLDVSKHQLHLARDTFGVRPMFRLVTDNGVMAVCSEAKGLTDIVYSDGIKGKIEPFPPGHYETYHVLPTGKVRLIEQKRFHTIGQPPLYKTVAPPLVDEISTNIQSLLRAAVKKRLMAERRIGCLLSGGLDSSLITALVVELAKQEGIQYKIQTFSTGMQNSPDLLAARKVAAHLGTEHYEVVFTEEEGLAVLDELIYHLETYDITTVRASVGMYIVSRFISQRTDTVVIYSGEGADELAEGYIYFHKSPSGEEADVESRRLLQDLYYFDVLRADRTTAAHGLEMRVPFLDHAFTSYYLSLPADLRRPRDGVEKYLIRSAFSGQGLLPDEILWRPKEAFSDGVSSQTRSWFTVLQEFAAQQVSDEELSRATVDFPYNTPQTKEALYYRKVFTKHFPGNENWLPYYWMPKWTNASDPSARTLTHYKQ